LNADGTGTPRRITTSNGIDTEPTFAPDGRTLYFVSDRGGGPQVYRMPVAGGMAQRVTFGGDYNVSPKISPDGKQMVYVARRAGRFLTAVMDLATGQETLVTNTTQDESPSFAPNGRYLLYATVEAGRDTLGMVSSDGRVRTRLTVAAGDVREPAWGPFFK
jgi:TolB protein